MLEVKSVCKRFALKDAKKVNQVVQQDPRIRGRFFYAIDNVGFNCHAGEVLGLLGANGAGKTTLLRLLSTALSSDSGEICFLQQNIQHQVSDYRKQIGFLSGTTGLYDRLTGRENLTYFARLYAMSESDAILQIENLIAQLNMGAFIDRRFGDYSTGMKQKVAIARAVLHQPKLVILDEPTTGLDIKAREVILNFIEQLSAKGIGVIFSTHDLSEVERLCQRICVIDQGQNKFLGDLNQLKQQTHSDTLHQALFSVMENGHA